MKASELPCKQLVMDSRGAARYYMVQIEHEPGFLTLHVLLHIWTWAVMRKSHTVSAHGP